MGVDVGDCVGGIVGGTTGSLHRLYASGNHSFEPANRAPPAEPPKSLRALLYTDSPVAGIAAPAPASTAAMMNRLTRRRAITPSSPRADWPRIREECGLIPGSVLDCLLRFYRRCLFATNRRGAVPHGRHQWVAQRRSIRLVEARPLLLFGSRLTRSRQPPSVRQL